MPIGPVESLEDRIVKVVKRLITSSRDRSPESFRTLQIDPELVTSISDLAGVITCHLSVRLT